MTCAETEILLHALLDDELDAGNARDVEGHLADCPRCAAQLDAYRAMRHAMSAPQLRYAAPMSLRRRIEAALPSAPLRGSCGTDLPCASKYSGGGIDTAWPVAFAIIVRRASSCVAKAPKMVHLS